MGRWRRATRRSVPRFSFDPFSLDEIELGAYCGSRKKQEPFRRADRTRAGADAQREGHLERRNLVRFCPQVKADAQPKQEARSA
jgi:hypothetical protein